MADPICRWRNATPSTLQLLVSLLPKQCMSEADFKKATEANCTRIGFKYDVFTGTAYQLATQLGLYYINERQTYYPRFNHDISIEEAKVYLIKAARSYVSPNPYTPSMNNAARAICIHDYLVQYAKSKGQGYEIDVKSVLQDAYGIGLGNMDIVVNLMVQAGDFEKVDAQHIIYKEESAMTKSEFFETFDAWKDKNALKNELGNLQLITYGAPGTGKSHKIDNCTNESNSIRVTFHPDTDYAAFVGTYKPTMVGTRKQVILDYENLVDKFKEYLSVQPTNVTRACALFGYDYHDSITDMINGGYTIPKLVDDAYKSGSSYDSVVRAGMSVYEKSPSETESISYSFVSQAFMKAYVEAWRRYTNAELQDDEKTYYLVIEEINRGNCAQIFGDLFQLLDRADNGFSAYAITPDDDIQKFLETDKDYKLSDIPLTVDIKKTSEDGEKVIATAADIKSGKKLVLPPNLCIWATMNTSDQSLFPIDSAFKRRWDWKYMPIKDEKKGWEIKFGDCKVDWWEFLVAINKIVRGVTNSADKQMGYFFVKAKDSVIDAEMFVNKVAFYLWNDVFKDCELDYDAFKITRDGDEVDVLAFQDFFKDDGTIDEVVLKSFLTKLVPQPEPENGAAPRTGTGA